MNEVFGMLLIFSAIIVGGTFLFGMDFTLKEKVACIIVFEVFVALIVFGSYLLMVER